MIVVKLGGSLFEHPRLGLGLTTYLESLDSPEILLLPGGGKLVDVVRELNRIHGLGEENSHWLALQAMTVAAELIARLIDLPTPGGRVRIPDPLAFARADESQPGALPHSWDVTSDSIAARMAIVYGAKRLILLKSIDIPREMDFSQATERGWVDAYFPKTIAGSGLEVDAVNFAAYLDSI